MVANTVYLCTVIVQQDDSARVCLCNRSTPKMWLQWPWTAKWPLSCAILPNLVVFGGYCVRVV